MGEVTTSRTRDLASGGSEPIATKRLRWRGVAGVIVVIVIAVIIVGLIIFGAPNFKKTEPWVAYFEGNIDIPKSTPIFYRNTTVGRVDSIVSGRVYLQVIANRFDTMEHRNVLTLPLNGSATLDDGTVVTYARERVVFAGGGETVSAMLDAGSGMWFLPHADSLKSAYLNDTLLKDVRRRLDRLGIPLFPGDQLRLERTSVEWSNPGFYTCVYGSINVNDVRDLSHDQSFLMNGSSLSRSSTFSLTSPVLNLFSSSDSTDLFPNRKAEGDSTRIEFVTNVDIDILEAVNQVGKYAFEKRFLYSPPRNRVERLVADANGLIPGVSARVDTAVGSITTDVNSIAVNVNDEVSAIGGDVRSQTLPALKAELRALQLRLSQGINSLENQMAMLRATAERPLNSADTTIKGANVAINGIDVSLGQTLNELSTTIRNLNLTVAKLKRVIP